MSVVHRRETCRLCGSRNVELVFQLAPSPIGDAYVPADRVGIVQELYPIDLFLCRDCGLSQLLDVISPDVLYGEYIYVTASSLGLADHFECYAHDVLGRVAPPQGGLVVDIGSNDGTLLRSFQKRGMRVLGVEPARQIAHDATAAGTETLAAFFTPDLSRQIRQSHGPASVITANNVFANVDDLLSLTAGIRDLLTPDGVFVMESYYLPDVIQNLVFDFIYHEHISSFAVKPLQTFFQWMGMQLIDVKRVPTKGGSIRYTVQLAGGGRAVQPSVAELIEFETGLGIYQGQSFRAFRERIDALKAKTVQLLSAAKAQGQSIAGFGASITATTLIYDFGIGGFLDYLVDDNPAKQGRFSPGLHLPVYAADALYRRKPDCAVILAWRYVEPIVKKYGDYLSRGGRFLVPVPEVKFLDRP